MNMLTGRNFIGNSTSCKGETTFHAINPKEDSSLEPVFYEATKEEVNQAVEKAEEAFRIYRHKSGEEKAVFLETIANEIMNLGDPLIQRCSEETALSSGRLTGERARTVNQLRLFAKVIREGSWVDARIDTAEPKPDIKSMKMALGPVGVFGASNFPFAFSVAGGDTASALASGCTVVVKAHPAHPGTCELIANAIQTAIEKTDMPDGTFSMIHGTSHQAGLTLVEHPLLKAVGFTGSFNGGKALFDAANKRPEPIPVYAEMGSTNPVFLLPGSLTENKEELAEGFINSVKLGAGQFCTNPGLVSYLQGDDAEEFRNILIDKFTKSNADTMLTSGICSAYEQGVKAMLKQEGVSLIAKANNDEDGKSTNENENGNGNGANNAIPHLFGIDAEHFLANPALEDEVFGPSSLAIAASNKDDLVKIADRLQGHLTATLYGTEEDLQHHQELISILQRKVGRLIFNGFPTGVEVNNAMIHGGPFPATTDSRTTSVGTYAIDRFVRPVCFQNFPDSQLPDELKSNNPLDIWRLVNGDYRK